MRIFIEQNFAVGGGFGGGFSRRFFLLRRDLGVILGHPLGKGDGKTAGAMMLHHIDHIEADLDLRRTDGLALKEALAL